MILVRFVSLFFLVLSVFCMSSLAGFRAVDRGDGLYEDVFVKTEQGEKVEEGPIARLHRLVGQAGCLLLAERQYAATELQNHCQSYLEIQSPGSEGSSSSSQREDKKSDEDEVEMIEKKVKELCFFSRQHILLQACADWDGKFEVIHQAPEILNQILAFIDHLGEEMLNVYSSSPSESCDFSRWSRFRVPTEPPFSRPKTPSREPIFEWKNPHSSPYLSIYASSSEFFRTQSPLEYESRLSRVKLSHETFLIEMKKLTDFLSIFYSLSQTKKTSPVDGLSQSSVPQLLIQACSTEDKIKIYKEIQKKQKEFEESLPLEEILSEIKKLFIQIILDFQTQKKLEKEKLSRS